VTPGRPRETLSVREVTVDAIVKGGWVARWGEGPADLAAALALRGRVFRGGRDDADAQDAFCRHVLVERDGVLAATYRLRLFARSDNIRDSYSGARYDLTRLAARGGAMVEMGRFCTAPGLRDPDPIRLAWAAATRAVEDWGAGFLFGCSSFAGTDPAGEAEALGLLAGTYLAPQDWAPQDWAPGVGAAEVFRLAGLPMPGDAARAAARLPGLLRSYLAMGGRVSDHAVIDRDLGTFHLFTGLDLAAVPPARAAALRDLGR
jgi:putative hemolysin